MICAFNKDIRIIASNPIDSGFWEKKTLSQQRHDWKNVSINVQILCPGNAFFSSVLILSTLLILEMNFEWSPTCWFSFAKQDDIPKFTKENWIKIVLEKKAKNTNENSIYFIVMFIIIKSLSYSMKLCVDKKKERTKTNNSNGTVVVNK